MNRRSGLGRGLESLIPSEVVSEKHEMFLEVPISAISANEFQPRSRFDEEALVSLTESIRELGVLQPILVRRSGPDRYELIAGERRWRAARRAGLAAVPAIVRDADDKTSLEHALVENLHREDLNALEEAAAYQQLIDDFSLTQEEVARRVGKSRSAVANTLRLFQLPTSVQKLVAMGELSAGHARALLSSPDRALQEELAQRCVLEGWNVRQIEELMRTANAAPDAAPKGSPSSKPGQTRSAALLEVEQRLGNHLDTRVSVAMGKSRGRMTIEFADLDDLDRIFRVVVGQATLDPE